MAPVTKALLIANIIVFGLQAMTPGYGLEQEFALWPLGVNFQAWQIVTYAFLHGDFTHLFFNMFGLYMFGSELERVFGTRRFIVFYFASVITAAIAQLIVTAWMGTPAPTVGASGGLFGLLLGFAVLFPRRKLMLLFPPIPMPAWLFVTLYGLAELAFGISRTATGIAHFAHLGGMLGGLLVLMSWSRRARR
jgi:membrane associated rhomboid family serine protease